LAQRSISAIQAFADYCKVTVRAQDSGALLYGDEDALVQTLVNLLSNAIKFSPEGSDVDLTCRTQGDKQIIKVIDHGCGIPVEDQKVIFDRFQRGGASNSKLNEDGTGLGLAIAKEIVELHGGEISLESRKNEGSTFSICLPSE
jgi:signal transduction histidine kinase